MTCYCVKFANSNQEKLRIHKSSIDVISKNQRIKMIYEKAFWIKCSFYISTQCALLSGDLNAFDDASGVMAVKPREMC